jgi:hypothetical protein
MEPLFLKAALHAALETADRLGDLDDLRGEELREELEDIADELKTQLQGLLDELDEADDDEHEDVGDDVAVRARVEP